MSKNTAIHWCDSTCNPVMGCDGCELWDQQHRYCYAGILHARHGGRNSGYATSFDNVTPFPGRIAEACKWSSLQGEKRNDKPWLHGSPRMIFLSDMGDAFCKSVSFEYLETEIIDNVTSDQGKRHIWLLLTKRPARMAEFSDWLSRNGIAWPKHLWAGTTVTTNGVLSRIDDLLGVGNDTTVRFVSVEPQWELIDLSPWLARLDWVIQGGQSGNIEKPFDIAWARAMRDQCQEGGVAYFLKQLGTHVVENGQRKRFKHRHGSDWAEWTKDLRVRDFPHRRKGR
jgi:protein gp37